MTLSPIIFADGILEASIANGVARLTLGQTAADGKPLPVGQLCIPLVQLAAVTKTLGDMLRQLEERARAQQAGGATPAAPAAGAEPQTMPGAFRFG